LYKVIRRESDANVNRFSSRVWTKIKPWRTPRVTASVRLAAPSLPMMDATWNLTVCSEIRIHLRSLMSESRPDQCRIMRKCC
jgi:hypothetical protein